MVWEEVAKRRSKKEMEVVVSRTHKEKGIRASLKIRSFAEVTNVANSSFEITFSRSTCFRLASS